MVKYKIIYDREACIGAFACTPYAPELWIMSKEDETKVDLAGSTYNKETKKWELIIDEKDFEANDLAAQACPVDVIVIEKIED